MSVTSSKDFQVGSKTRIREHQDTATTSTIKNNGDKHDINITELSLDDIKTFDSGIRSTNMLEAKVVSGIERRFVFKVLEVMVHDQLTAENVPAYSIGQYEIFADSHTKWTTYDINALYYIRRGNPLFWIGDEGQTIKSGNYIVVPAGVKHCMYNKSDTISVKIDIIFPGKINIPSQLSSKRS